MYLTKLLVDALASVVGHGLSPEGLQFVAGPALLMAGTLLLQELLQSALEWVRTAQAELVKDHISTLFHQKAYTVDLAFFESAENYDRLHRAQDSGGSRSLDLIENLGNFLQNTITLVAIAAVLVPYGAWVPLALLISMLPVFYVVFHFNWRYYQWWKQTTPDQRRTHYYNWLLTYSEPAAEVRLFNQGPQVEAAYQGLRRRLRDERLRLLKDQGLARLGTGTFALIVTGAVLVWMGGQVMRGAATLGDIALFYQAFHQGQGLMRTLMRNLGQIYGSALFLGNLFEFLDVEPRIVEPPHPVPVPIIKEGIRFRNVTFRYPGSDRPALEHFHLMIPAGKTVAIVGANGAGKSTLIKLLCRFYDPDAGRIELDGVDVRQFAIGELQRKITVLFQFPVHYHDTAAGNIEVADQASQADRARTEAAARAAGAHALITHLEQGYDTQLGRLFLAGTELSGGEWQRMALARAFFRQAPVVVLDEPTSLMDSWAENKWLDRFHGLVQGRTALIITHRFTTAKRADIIHVMHGGRIVESGVHEELLVQNGCYAQSWKAQMRDGLQFAVEAKTDGV